MRVLTWNIQHGGGRRIPAILETLFRHDPDAVVLTEFRANPGGLKLAEQLRSHGYGFQHLGSSVPDQNSVFVATRQPSTIDSRLKAPPELAHRCVPISWEGTTLVGLYFAMKREKMPLFEHLLGLPADASSGRTLLIGDFNTGRHLLDEAGSTFVASEYLNRLESLGWVDAWRLFHPDAREFSWVSGHGNGFRVDHVLCTRTLLDSIRSVEYSHREREARVSDHSVMIVDLSGTNGERRVQTTSGRNASSV